MKNISVAFPAVIVALVVLLLGIGWWGYQYALPVFAFPLCIGLFVIAMASIATVLAYRQKDMPTPEETAPAAGHSEVEGLLLEAATWVQLGCVLALMVLCWVLGFIPGIAIFLFVYLWRFGWKPWFAAVCGLAFSTAIWLLFGLLFSTPLPFWPVWIR